MKIKLYNNTFIFSLVVFCLAGCNKPRDFFPDPYNPGLSRFTSRGYDIVSAYINDTAYANPYINSTGLFSVSTGSNSPVSINVIHTSSLSDTLSISWQIAYSDSGIESNPPYYSLSLLMPVPKSFSEIDFLRFQGQRFPLDSATNISIQLNSINYYTNGNYYYNANPLTGPAGIYFVSISAVPGDTTGLFSFSGLFDGSIGNNISITKGRFDFYINPSEINY